MQRFFEKAVTGLLGQCSARPTAKSLENSLPYPFFHEEEKDAVLVVGVMAMVFLPLTKADIQARVCTSVPDPGDSCDYLHDNKWNRLPAKVHGSRFAFA